MVLHQLLVRQIAAELVAWFLLAEGSSVLVFLAAQGLKVAQVFSGADASWEEMLLALCCLATPVAAWAAGPAVAVAVLAVCGRMAADGELVAIDATGISRRVLIAAPLTLIGTAALLAALLALGLAPGATATLRDLALELVTRAAVGRLEPRAFSSPLPGLSFSAEAADGAGHFRLVFVADYRAPSSPIVCTAEQAVITPDLSRRALALTLLRGHAFSLQSGQAPSALSFGRLELQLPFGTALDERLDFLPPALTMPTAALLAAPPPGMEREPFRYALYRRLQLPLAVLGLGAVALALAQSAALVGRLRGVGLAALVYLGYHLACRGLELLMSFGAASAWTAAFVPPLALAACALALSRFGRAMRG